MAEEKDKSIFDVNAIVVLNNKDRSKRLTIGAYNGNMQFSLGDGTYEKGVRPRSILVIDQLRDLICHYLRKLINNPAPDTKHSIVINGRFNRETRKRELSAVITVGIDDTGTGYLGVKHVGDDGEAFIGKFELSGVTYIEADDYSDDKSRSLGFMRSLLHVLETTWPISSLFTRNNLYKRSFGGNKGGTKVTSKPAPDDEIF